MTQSNQAGATLILRISAYVNRYRTWGLRTFAVLATIAFFAAQIFPEVGNFLVSRGVIPYLTLLVVLDVAVSMQAPRGPVATRFVRDQDEALPALEEAARRCRRGRADLLEYAGQTILPLIRTLHREGVPIRMLVQHPDKIEGLQLQRNLTTLDTIYNSIFRGSNVGVEVRCYRAPYSLRGRLIGNELLELGWLTPDLIRKTAHGHDNPSVLVNLAVNENAFLRNLFATTFDDLWNADATEDARPVFERLHAGR